ncbi:MAG: SPOR domain-containing protein [Pseudomonadota bacterium]
MLKFIFWSLLASNVALYAYGQGYLGHFSGNEREPARLKNQLNADKLAMISAAKASANAVAAQKPVAPPAPPPTPPAPTPVPAPAPVVVEKKVEKVEKVERIEKIACIEIGNFLQPEARRFEAQLAPLNLGDHQVRHNMPGTEITSYIVYIPPQGSKEGADKKAGELRELGVSNYFIMSDSPNMRWAISLGVFKSETGAQTLLASLLLQGVHSARIAPRMGGSKHFAYQFRDIGSDVKARIEKIRAGFPNQESRSCK